MKPCIERNMLTTKSECLLLRKYVSRETEVVVVVVVIQRRHVRVDSVYLRLHVSRTLEL